MRDGSDERRRERCGDQFDTAVRADQPLSDLGRGVGSDYPEELAGTPRRLEAPRQSRGQPAVGVRQPSGAVQHGDDHRFVGLVGPALAHQFGGVAALRAPGQHARLALGRQPGQVGRKHADEAGDDQPGPDHPARPATRQALDDLQSHLTGTPGPRLAPTSSTSAFHTHDARSPVATAATSHFAPADDDEREPGQSGQDDPGDFHVLL